MKRTLQRTDCITYLPHHHNLQEQCSCRQKDYFGCFCPLSNYCSSGVDATATLAVKYLPRYFQITFLTLVGLERTAVPHFQLICRRSWFFFS